MFGDSFLDFLGPAAPVGEVIEQDDDHFLLLHKLKHFVGCYIGVKVDSPDDRIVHGKPLVCVIRTEEKLEHDEQVRKGKTIKRQVEFATAVREAQPEVEAPQEYPGHEPKPVNAWEVSMPRSKAKKDWPCLQSNPKCPAKHVVEVAIVPLVATTDEEFLDSFCEHHRLLLDAYLAEHPDAWPPKDEG